MLLSGLFLLCLALLLPGHYPPWVSFQQQWLAALGVALIGASATLAATKGGGRIRWPVAASLTLAVAIVPWLQWAAGQLLRLRRPARQPVHRRLRLGDRCRRSLTGSQGRVARWLCTVLIVAATISTGMALWQWLQLGSSLYVADLRPGGRPFANLAQPNH
jgi:hypothetical protein